MRKKKNMKTIGGGDIQKSVDTFNTNMGVSEGCEKEEIEEEFELDESATGDSNWQKLKDFMMNSDSKNENFYIGYFDHNSVCLYEEKCDNKKEAIDSAKAMCEVYANDPTSCLGLFGIKVMTESNDIVFERYANAEGKWLTEEQHLKEEEEKYCPTCGTVLTTTADGKKCVRCEQKKKEAEKVLAQESLRKRAYKIKNESILNKVDRYTNGEHDLLNYYNITNLTESDKEHISNMIAESIQDYLDAKNNVNPAEFEDSDYYEIEPMGNGFTVFYNGDDVYFDTREEAEDFIKEKEAEDFGTM